MNTSTLAKLVMETLALGQNVSFDEEASPGIEFELWLGEGQFTSHVIKLLSPDPKVVKQLRKDLASVREAVENERKEYEASHEN